MKNAKVQVNLTICSEDSGDGIAFQSSTMLDKDVHEWMKETLDTMERILKEIPHGENKTVDCSPQNAVPITDGAAGKEPKFSPHERYDDGVKGLLILQCPSCKLVFRAFTKNPKKEWNCKCGAKIALSKDTTARFECTCKACGKITYGRTNTTNAVIEAGDLNCACGELCPEMLWNPMLRIYKG